MIDIFKNYLKKEEYYIIIYSIYVYIYKYIDIIKFTDTSISLRFKNLVVDIIGEDLLIVKMEQDELLIKGKFKKMEKKYV